MNNYLFMQDSEDVNKWKLTLDISKEELTLPTSALSLVPNIQNLKPVDLGV